MVRLSEAIRRGEGVSKGQLFNGKYAEYRDGGVYTCAFAGALLSVSEDLLRKFISSSTAVFYDFDSVFFDPKPSWIEYYCPMREYDNNLYFYSIINLIEHLNDDHQWSRGQIADYIETLGH